MLGPHRISFPSELTLGVITELTVGQDHSSALSLATHPPGAIHVKTIV